MPPSPSSKPCISKCGAYYKSDHNVTVLKLKYVLNKYKNDENMIKISSSSGISMTNYHNDSHLS